jgi:S-layer homology domain
MSNLFKKVTSSVALLAVVFSVVSPIAGANAAYTSSIEAANKLAASGVITDKSANPADYRLGDNITRREMVKVAMQLASCQDVTLNTEYKGKFSDVASSDWAWKYAETAVDNGFIAANATFSPARNVSKAEALKMVMNATQVAKSDAGVSFWADYVAGGVAAGIVDDFSDYNTQAQRGWIFKAAASALDAGTCGADSGSTIDDLLNDLDGTDGTSTGTTDTGSVTTTGGTFTVALSPDTAASASIPAGVNGLPVASYDFTAGDSDVTVTSITLKRRGLSDKDTLTGLAAFTSDGRASKAKNDSENNDTEATLTLTNGFVVKAGETRTLTIVADVNDTETTPSRDADIFSAMNDEFAVELVEVVASATAQSDGSLVANTMRVGSVDAAQITVANNGTVSNPKLGDTGVEIFKFKVTGDTNEDTMLKGITFKADNSNASDDFKNFKLYQGSTEIASTKMMEGKYVTFNLGTGINIAQNKTEKFTVKADVVTGAGDIVKFFVDKNLDVNAAGSRYGYGASVNIAAADAAGELGSVTLQAGELSLTKIDAPSDKIREDKKDTVLGSIKVTNVAGKNLELQQFGVKMDAPYVTGAILPLTSTPTTVAGNLNGTQLDAIFENFELYNQDTGASYELTRDSSNVYSDSDLNVAIPQGTTTYLIRADVKKNVTTTFDKYKFTLSLTAGAVTSNGGFYAVETSDDKVVGDVSPSSLTWKTSNGTESAATVSVTPLSNVTKVQGSTDVVALQFEVQADQSSALILNEVRAALFASGAAATLQEISQVSLYKGSVSDANLLKRVSGSNLASGGVATFNGFNVAIPASAKQTFIVTTSLVDASFVNKTPVTTKLTLLAVQDDENNDVSTPDFAGTPTPNGTTYAVPYVSGRSIAVSPVGTLTVTADANNNDNKDDKTVLAGTSKVIYSADVQATNESVDVEQVVFTVSGTYAGGKTLKDVVTSASLYLGDTLIATNTNSDINAVATNTIRFKDLSNLIIPQETRELRLAINTATIGFERVGATTTALAVTNIAMPKADGVDSGKSITVADLGTTTTATKSKATAIAPAVLTASVTKTLANGTAEVKFNLDTGDNKVALSNNKPVVELVDATLTNLAGTGTYNIYNVDHVVTGKATFASLDQADRIISDTETYVLVPQTTSQGTTYTTKIGKAGITYMVDSVAPTLNVNMTADLDLGTKTY